MEELTMQQVLEVIKSGDEYVATDNEFRLREITKNKYGDIIFKYVDDSFYTSGELHLDQLQKFKKKENKVKCRVAMVEASVGGKQYSVLVEDNINPYDLIGFKSPVGQTMYGCVLEVDNVLVIKEELAELRRQVRSNKEKIDKKLYCIAKVEDCENTGYFYCINEELLGAGTLGCYENPDGFLEGYCKVLDNTLEYLDDEDASKYYIIKLS